MKKQPKKIPEYREDRDHSSFVCSIRPYFESMEDLSQQIKSSILKSSYFTVQEMSFQDMMAEVENSNQNTKSGTPSYDVEEDDDNNPSGDVNSSRDNVDWSEMCRTKYESF